jgi:hypothetical protein
MSAMTEPRRKLQARGPLPPTADDMVDAALGRPQTEQSYAAFVGDFEHFVPTADDVFTVPADTDLPPRPCVPAMVHVGLLMWDCELFVS